MLTIRARLRPIRSATNPKSTPPAPEARRVRVFRSPAVCLLMCRSCMMCATTSEYSITSNASSIHPSAAAIRVLRCPVLASAIKEKEKGLGIESQPRDYQRCVCRGLKRIRCLDHVCPHPTSKAYGQTRLSSWRSHCLGNALCWLPIAKNSFDTLILCFLDPNMLSSERIHDIFSRIQKCSSADDVEAIIAGGRSALTRFANNTIHQNVAEEGYVTSIRVALDGKTARATTNRLDDESLKRAVQSAEQIARVQARDPDLLPVPAPDEAGKESVVQRHFGATAAIKPEDRAAAVEQIVGVAKQHKQTTAGIYSSSETMEALLNSHGVTKIHRQTSSEVSITMLANDSSGWQKANSPNVANLQPKHLAEVAAEKAAKTAHPNEVPPGKYTVILEPAAVLDLLGFMFFDFGGTALLEQRSFLNNRVGTRLFGDNITIHDDVYHALQSGATFDGEGVGRRRVTLVDKGVVKSLVFSRGTARKMQDSETTAKLGKIEPTGHGFPLPNEIGDAPMNIVVEGGNGKAKSVNEMVTSTERGILVTRLWYIREVDPYEKILTGMTRDGTFLIEKGKLQGGVRNFRFNQSLIDMLQNVEMLSVSVRASGEESFDMVVPAMKVNNFNFTELTKF